MITRAQFAGSSIVTTSWATTAIFGVLCAVRRGGLDGFGPAVIVVSLLFFAAGLVIWGYAFFRGVGRSRYDDVTVSGLFFLRGTGPRAVRVHMLGSLVLAVVAAGIAAPVEPFAVLEPVLPLALAGLWGSRHGTFPKRRAATTQ